MLNYTQIIQRLVSALNNLGQGYISVLGLENSESEAIFACKIVSILEHNRNLLHFLSRMHRQDFSDSLITHKGKYIKFMEENSISKNEIIAFKNSIDLLCSGLDEENHISLEDLERDAISELVYKMVKISQTIFAEQSHNKDSIYSLLAFSSVANLPNLSLKDQATLFDKIVLIKEVWAPNPQIALHSDHPIFKFFVNPYKSLELETTDDLYKTFASIISYFTEQNNVLKDLTNENLIAVYDRVKNYNWKCASLPILLNNVHIEAQLRYSCTRISDSGYELLQRFQSFDVIILQIENLEFSLLESYLNRKQPFVDKLLHEIINHLDNIKALNIIKNEYLISMLSTINTYLLKEESSKNEPGKATISSIKSALATSLEPHLRKKYFELDQFALQFLTEKYSKLFKNITDLIERKNEYKKYLKDLFVSGLTNEYYLPNWSNSIAKLRGMSKDRKEIKLSLLELDFIEMFEPQYLNKITLFNFKKRICEADLRSPINFIEAIIREMVSLSTASQLEVLCKPLLTEKLSKSKTEILLKNEISNQIYQRTSIIKMIGYFLLGRKKDYDKLVNIGKVIDTL